MRRCRDLTYYQLLLGNVSNTDFLTALLLLHLSAGILLQGRPTLSFCSFIKSAWTHEFLFYSMDSNHCAITH